MANKRKARQLFVKSSHNITPNMRRVTLHGDDLASFPEDSEGAYIKLVFEQKDTDNAIMRTYTIAGQRSDHNEIDIDFMLHTDSQSSVHGIAAPWSM